MNNRLPKGLAELSRRVCTDAKKPHVYRDGECLTCKNNVLRLRKEAARKPEPALLPSEVLTPITTKKEPPCQQIPFQW